MTKLFSALALSFLLLQFAGYASAQTETPPGADRTGTVTGQIVNGTEGGKIPGGLALMLHAWDENGETVMLDGVADSAGAFRFDDVPMKDGWVFTAMLAYNDVTFFSEPGEVRLGMKEVTLPVTIYETASDATSVYISQLHTLLDFGPDEVIVNEIYILSNPTDRAIVGGLTLADGKTATLQFTLPAGANKVKFERDDSGSRFIVTPDGFADTGAVLPGEETTQVMLTYTLPYSSGMAISHPVNYPVAAANVMTRADSGVTLTGNGLAEARRRELAPDAVFDVYAVSALVRGESLAVTLAGEPVYRVSEEIRGTMDQAQTLAPNTLASRWGIPVGGGLLGLAMIGLGVWWWRRSSDKKEEDIEQEDWPGTAQSVLNVIAALDEAHERGEVSDEDYQARRAELRTQARAVLQARESAP